MFIFKFFFTLLKAIPQILAYGLGGPKARKRKPMSEFDMIRRDFRPYDELNEGL